MSAFALSCRSPNSSFNREKARSAEAEFGEEEEVGDANASDSSDDAPELAAHEKFGQRKRKLPRSLVGTGEMECELLRNLVFL